MLSRLADAQAKSAIWNTMPIIVAALAVRHQAGFDGVSEYRLTAGYQLRHSSLDDQVNLEV